MIRLVVFFTLLQSFLLEFSSTLEDLLSPAEVHIVGRYVAQSAWFALAEMIDLKEHGITLPAISDDVKETPDGKLDFSHHWKIAELRKKAGLTKGPVLKVRNGLGIGEYAYATDAQ